MSTLDFGLSLEKRLQTVTFSPAVFRADILASMFDILKQKDDFFSREFKEDVSGNSSSYLCSGFSKTITYD